MRIDAKTIRFQGALHGLCELPDGDRLIIHSEQSLVAVSWPALRQTPDTVTVVLGPPGQGKALATNVAVDNAWVVEPKARRVLMAREGEFYSVDPSGQLEDQRIKVAGLPRGTFAAALDSDGQRVLLVVMRVLNPDFAEYGVGMADLANGRLVAEATIGVNADLDLLWDAPLRTWVIGDTSRGALWRWDGARPAVKLAGPPAGPVHAATFAETGEGVIVSALFTQTTGATGLITGRAEWDRVVWAAPVTLPGSPVLLARRHPARALWACLAQEGAVQQIQIRDAAGELLAEAGVRPAAQLNTLHWSKSLPNHVWGVGIRALAAATPLSLMD
jgi:hypothetical protein